MTLLTVRYEVRPPSDSFAFWDLVGKLSDALAKLALEDPNNPLPKFLSINVNKVNNTIWVDSGFVYYRSNSGVEFHVLRSNGEKTIIIIIDRNSVIPVDVVIADRYTVIDDLPDEALEQALKQ